jgi:L-ascorbate metabolism protein UlaG (beta-lactamase superfamily)
MVEDLVDSIEWLGHSGFRINGDKVVYLDPYEIDEGPGADLILISHSHYDHCSPEDVRKIQKKDTVIVTEKTSVKKLQGDIRIVQPGDCLTVCGLSISVVPAYNINKTFHPKANGWLGFIVDFNGVRLYHTGDSDLIPEMNDIRADVALLPVSGTFVMTPLEAVEAALIIGPKIAIPMHYGEVVGDVRDARAFKKGLEGKIDVRILEKD